MLNVPSLRAVRTAQLPVKLELVCCARESVPTKLEASTMMKSSEQGTPQHLHIVSLFFIVSPGSTEFEQTRKPL